MKKLISIMLVLCMVLGMNVGVFAAGTCASECSCGCNVTDTWDGTVDTSWYNDTDIEFTLTTAEQLAGLAELVTGNITLVGKTIKLGANLDLYCEDTSATADGDPVTFRPIGDYSKSGTFEGTFDGQGHTISKLYQNGWDLGYEWGKYGSYGLFGNLNDATIKNLTLSGAESYIEGGDVAGIAGSATGTCVFENITIMDSIFATYNNGCGGIVAWSGAGNYTFKNVTIAKDVTLAGLWGSFDSSIGGIVGQAEPGATYNLENVYIACRIDAYNDCTASYDYYNYRMCGMMLGRCAETTTIDGANYPDTSKYNITCDNVTVNYGDWMNYEYCRAEGARAVRVQAGYSYDGIAADYDHSKCTVHHMEKIPFDQIIGGDQYAVKGLKTYNGVNVYYPDQSAPSAPAPMTPALPDCCVNGTCCGTQTIPPVKEDTSDDQDVAEVDTHTSKSELKELMEDVGENEDTVTVEVLGDDATISYSALKLATEEGLGVELDGTDNGYFWRFALGENALKDFKGSFKSYVDIDAGLSTSLKKNLKESKKYQIFKTEHEGNVPKVTTLGVKLIKELRSEGKLYLYYWNSDKRQVEKMDITMFKEGNYLCMELDHCSTYIITSEPIASAVEQGAVVTTPVISGDKINPETGASDVVGIVATLAIVSALSVAVLNLKK